MRDVDVHLQEFVSDRSEPAFNQLVANHLALVHSTAVRRLHGDSHLAQDITQLVFLDLATQAAELPSGVPLAGWLYRHTCFKAAETLRATQRRRQREARSVQEQSLQSAVADPDWSQLGPVLDEALAELAPADRDVLVLRFFAQRCLRDVGNAFGLGEDAAQKRVSRALDRLRLQLQRRGIASTAAALGTALGTQAVTPVPAGLAAGILAAVRPHLVPPVTRGAVAATRPWGRQGSTLRQVGIVTAIAVAPLLVQQVQIATAESRYRQLGTEQQLQREQARASARQLHELERQWAGLQDRQSRLTASLATAAAVAAERAPAGDPQLYRWDPETDWVRLPKSMLTNLPIRAWEGVASPGSPRHSAAPINPRGTPSPALLDVLGVEPDAQPDLTRFCEDFFQRYEADAAGRSRFLTSLPPDLPTGWIQPQPHLHLRLTPALPPTESAPLRDAFRQGLQQQLGPERTAAFWHQISEVLLIRCDDFGSVTRLLGLRPASPGSTEPDRIPASRPDQAWTLIRIHRRAEAWQFDGEAWAGDYHWPGPIAALAASPELPFPATPVATQP